MKSRILFFTVPVLAAGAIGVMLHAQQRQVIRISGRTVVSMRQIAENTKSLDWSPKLNVIAFERVSPNRFFQVYTMNPDGSGERCLTCGGDAPRKHNGSPTWHPSGRFIAFGAEKEDTPSNLDQWAVPGKGLNCDVWVMTADGKRYWQLTKLPLGKGRDIPGVIHPQFSPNGRRLFWAERLGGGGSWGRWALRVADFVESPEPHLENIRTVDPSGRAEDRVSSNFTDVQPQQFQGGALGRWRRMREMKRGGGAQRGGNAQQSGDMPPFYESHDFSSDSRKILFSANLIKGQPQHGLDIYEYDLDSRKTTRLTDSDTEWDEHAHFSPDGRKIIWMSSSGLDITWGDTTASRWQKFLKTELWMMNADGSGKERLTYFNDKGAPEYFGDRVIVSDNSWGPDGRQIVVNVAYEAARGLRSKCFILDLK